MVEELENCASEKNEKGAEGQHEATQAISYLRRHGEYGYLQYLRCKRHRITRGSGAIESTIRRVINLRLKSNATYWLEENAEGVFALRALLLCDRWETTLTRLRGAMARDRRISWQWDAPDLANLKADQKISPPSTQPQANQQHPALAL